MKQILLQEDRDKLMKGLTDEQKDFIINHVKRGKKTRFANELAREKGANIPINATLDEVEDHIDWVLIDYIDAGKVSKENRCECGRPLRYRYVVRNQQSGEVKSLGIEHLKEYTGITAEVIKEIISGFMAIDYELDEILIKIRDKWSLKGEGIILPAEFVLPNEIKEHLANNVPLLERQVKLLKRKLDDYLKENPQIKLFKQKDNETIRAPKPAPTINSFSKIDAYNDLDLPEHLHNIVLSYLSEGIYSAREICEMLIKYHSVTAERYLSGKPRMLYSSVCVYLDDLVQQDKCVLLHRDNIDRLYNLR